ncbi:GNAT family N-acetyltransferase [Endozoicomonas sp. OPT23]|uniref:GNAT family N-acetyltransferase n=1 Tax=Endozoicomonas sp. OPT23 TaxID=2072845 RepID=UPI00129AED12|nr:GNAT family N-acetyltransferase [Endozoicomonas sp. OPT23]MRI34062.1 GNAT family N-acetyltransferase [Endozoicomonas sp. OPT23]
MICWQWCQFSELDVSQLYDLLALRQRVFVVEQNCVYQDADHLDQQSWHLLGWEEDELVASLRVISSVATDDQVTLGRIVTAPEIRGTGVGQDMMHKTLDILTREFPERTIGMSAQAHLQDFYSRFGFQSQGEEYDEDGIPHIHMSKGASQTP